MLVHHYDQKTGIYISSSDADESPLEPGVFMVPAFATDAALPDEREGYNRVFDRETEEWSLELIPVPVVENIVAAPKTLFGGKSMKGIFYGN